MASVAVMAAGANGIIQPTAFKTLIQTLLPAFATPLETIPNMVASQLGMTTTIPGLNLATLAVTVLALSPSYTTTISSASLPTTGILYLPLNSDDVVTLNIDGKTQVITDTGSGSFSMTVNGGSSVNYVQGAYAPWGNSTIHLVAGGSVGVIPQTITTTTTTAAPNPSVTCFLKDAPVLTPGGYRPIASLKVGDLVQTADGRSVAIQKVSIQKVVASAATNPFVVPKGKFGATKRLYISPNHKLLVVGEMVGEMVAASSPSLGLDQKIMTGSFNYYNLELPAWENMIVAGVTVESLAPVRRITVTLAEFAALLVKTYGSDVTLAKIKDNGRVRFLSDGRVNIPVIVRR